MIRTIKIAAVLNGFFVTVGCQELVFESRERLLTELDGYLKNPNATEKHYRENAIHRDKLNCQQPADPTPCPASPAMAQVLNAGSPVCTNR